MEHLDDIFLREKGKTDSVFQRLYQMYEWEMQIFVSEPAWLLYYRYWNEITPLCAATDGAQIQICEHWAARVESEHLSF